MATTKRVTPGRKGYKILFAENTVIMNHKFAAAAAQCDTKEYDLMKIIRTDFPGMKEVVVSGRECHKAKPNHRLTYRNMETYISVYENAQELLEVFESVKAMSKATASPYKYVCDWFKAQFPDYKKTPLFKDGELVAAPEKVPDITEYKLKLSKAA
jgi:hypothetical protein